MVHIYNGILLSHKKNIYSNMDGPRDCHTECRERQVSYDINYIQNIKKGANELTYKTELQL